MIADTGTKNIGFQSLDGVDFNISYDWTMGNWQGVDLGAWNTGLAGTYNIKNDSQDTSTSALISNFTLNQDAHLQKVRMPPRLSQADLDGGSSLSVTAFWNYIGHFGPTPIRCRRPASRSAMPTCASYGPNFAQYTAAAEPAATRSDLGHQYVRPVDRLSTPATAPSNDNLKNMHFQFTVNNILDTAPPFEYEVSPPGGGKPHAFYTSTASPELNPNGTIVNFVDQGLLANK